ncbi:MAG: hypothetical protein EOP50_10120, partial [Sphingobacteriales bacterium]
MRPHSTYKTGLAALWLALLSVVYAPAQTLTGTVSERVNTKTVPLVGVTIYWAGTSVSTTSTDTGFFTIPKSD